MTTIIESSLCHLTVCSVIRMLLFASQYASFSSLLNRLDFMLCGNLLSSGKIMIDLRLNFKPIVIILFLVLTASCESVKAVDVETPFRPSPVGMFALVAQEKASFFLERADMASIAFNHAHLCLACQCDGWSWSSHFVAKRVRPSVLLFKLCS